MREAMPCQDAGAPGGLASSFVKKTGTDRISRGHDTPGVWKCDHARIIAVCDVDLRP